jgi:phage terminase small subunit
MAAKNAEKPLANAKHEAVLQAYIADPERVGYRCYIGVYRKSSEGAAKTAFSRLLKNADFVARLQLLSADVSAKVVEKTAITIERTVAELAKIGFSNMENYMRAGADGSPRLHFSELTSDQKAALQEVTCEEQIAAVGDGDDEDGQTTVLVRKTKFKLYNKQPALVSILEHLGGFPAQKHADPDGRALGVGAAEKLGEYSDLEAARRVAFLLASGARQAPAKAAPPAPVAKAAKKAVRKR